MRNQIKFTFQIGLPMASNDFNTGANIAHRYFRKEVIEAATRACGGCTQRSDVGWWREDGDSHQSQFAGTLAQEECFTIELTCETRKAEGVYQDMVEAITISAAEHKVDTNWVHVTETPMVGRHFSVQNTKQALGIAA